VTRGGHGAPVPRWAAAGGGCGWGPGAGPPAGVIIAGAYGSPSARTAEVGTGVAGTPELAHPWGSRAGGLRWHGTRSAVAGGGYGWAPELTRQLGRSSPGPAAVTVPERRLPIPVRQDAGAGPSAGEHGWWPAAAPVPEWQLPVPDRQYGRGPGACPQQGDPRSVTRGGHGSRTAVAGTDVAGRQSSPASWGDHSRGPTAAPAPGTAEVGTGVAGTPELAHLRGAGAGGPRWHGTPIGSGRWRVWVGPGPRPPAGGEHGRGSAATPASGARWAAAGGGCGWGSVDDGNLMAALSCWNDAPADAATKH
jgi:hypothetical protein